jgi:hypothetical protein
MNILEMEYEEYKGRVEDTLIEMNHSKLTSRGDFYTYLEELYWDGYSVFEAATDVLFYYAGE